MGFVVGSDVGYWYGLLTPELLFLSLQTANNSGGSALMAVDVLRSKGVPEDHILFLNLIASPEGVQNFAEKFPKVRVVTAFVDEGLNDKKYVIYHFTHCLLY